MRAIIVFSLVLLIAVASVPGTGVGQTAEAASDQVRAAEQLARQNQEKFRQWRDSIPDYEKRLYDRVKRINKRTVKIQGLLVIGVILILIVNLAAIVMLTGWSGGAPAATPGVASDAPADPASLAGIIKTERAFIRSIANQVDRVRLRNLSRRQSALRNAVVELEGFVASTDGSNQELADLMGSIKDWTEKIQKEVDETVRESQAERQQ